MSQLMEMDLPAQLSNTEGRAAVLDQGETLGRTLERLVSGHHAGNQEHTIPASCLLTNTASARPVSSLLSPRALR